jgi:hypothetical protein
MTDPRASVDRALRAAGWAPARWADDLYERKVSPLFVLHAQFWFDEGLDAAVWIVSERADALLGDDGDLTAGVEAEPLEADDVEALIAAVLAAAAELEPFADVETFLAQDGLDPRVAAAVRDAAAGRRPSDTGDDISWAKLLSAGLKRARERRENPPPPEDRRQLSWSDLLRTGRTVKRVLDGEATVVPDRDKPWHRVALSAGAAPVLARAREASPMQVLTGAWVQARLEPGEGSMRVLLGGVEVGTLAVDAPAATVVGRLERIAPGEPYLLEVQLR